MGQDKLSCRYKSCDKDALQGSLFCEDHSRLGSGGHISEWLEKIVLELPAAIVVYIALEVLKKVMGLSGLSNATLRRLEMLAARLDKEISVRDDASALRALDDVKNFFKENDDPRFRVIVDQVLRDSGKYAQIGEDAEVPA